MKKALIVVVSVVAIGLLTFGLASLLDVNLDAVTEADDNTSDPKGTRFGSDGVTICVEGVVGLETEESLARESVETVLSGLEADPRWGKITTTQRSAEEQIESGCAAEPMALKPGVRVVHLGGSKGVRLEGVPAVSEPDPIDIRVYVLTNEQMEDLFGSGERWMLTAEAWLIDGSHVSGTNQALYLSEDVADDLTLLDYALRQATGLWEPEW